MVRGVTGDLKTGVAQRRDTGLMPEVRGDLRRPRHHNRFAEALVGERFEKPARLAVVRLGPGADVGERGELVRRAP